MLESSAFDMKSKAASGSVGDFEAFEKLFYDYQVPIFIKEGHSFKSKQFTPF